MNEHNRAIIEAAEAFERAYRRWEDEARHFTPFARKANTATPGADEELITARVRLLAAVRAKKDAQLEALNEMTREGDRLGLYK